MKHLLVLFCALSVGCTPEKNEEVRESEPLELEWSSPDEWGPLGVGAFTMEWVDGRGKEMVAEVWYPARVTEDDVRDPYPPLGLSGEAVRYAEPDSRFGPYPLVAFSHGYGGIRFQSIYLTEFLASHGFVVVSSQHRYNTFLDMNDDHLLDITVQRPGDVIESVDELLRRVEDEEDMMMGQVDGEEYAIVGHSFGALTSMMVGGGVLDLDGLVARCEAGTGRLCGSIGSLTDEMLASHRMTDPRAVVTVPMSPGMWYAFGSDGVSAAGLQEVRQPLVLGGDADNVLDYVGEIYPSYENMGSPKVLANFHDTGHYAFSNMCDLAPFFTSECDGVDGGWSDVAEIQRLSRTIVLAHIRGFMKDEPLDQPFTATEWLSDSVGVTVESQ
ncbi:MAG: alpha/beta hydrolase family protein [Myxococcota bacterium]